jgi:hypothetical protein
MDEELNYEIITGYEDGKYEMYMNVTPSVRIHVTNSYMNNPYLKDLVKSAAKVVDDIIPNQIDGNDIKVTIDSTMQSDFYHEGPFEITVRFGLPNRPRFICFSTRGAIILGGDTELLQEAYLGALAQELVNALMVLIHFSKTGKFDSQAYDRLVLRKKRGEKDE